MQDVKTQVLSFQTRRQVTNLYKGFLIMLEDLMEDHAAAFEKLHKALPEHSGIIDVADFFDEEKMSYLRKKVLDAGNDCIRAIAKVEEETKDEKERTDL